MIRNTTINGVLANFSSFTSPAPTPPNPFPVDHGLQLEVIWRPIAAQAYAFASSLTLEHIILIAAAFVVFFLIGRYT